MIFRPQQPAAVPTLEVYCYIALSAELHDKLGMSAAKLADVMQPVFAGWLELRASQVFDRILSSLTVRQQWQLRNLGTYWAAEIRARASYQLYEVEVPVSLATWWHSRSASQHALALNLPCSSSKRLLSVNAAIFYAHSRS